MKNKNLHIFIVLIALFLLIQFYSYNNKKISEQKKSDNNINQIVGSDKSSHNYLTKYPFFLNCENLTYKKWTVLSNNTQKVDYSIPADKKLHNEHIARAVLVYFPIKKQAEYMNELKWLYRSWIEMQKHEPKNWRTDIIIFIQFSEVFFNNGSNFLEELDCKFTNIRTAKTDKPMCTLINYVALSNRTVSAFNQADYMANYQKLLKDVDIFSDDAKNLDLFYSVSKEALSNYGYVDSILMAFDGYKYFKSAKYDFLIRSDMDVFLTPLFAKWLPDNCNDFYVGKGGYSETFNRKRLARVAEDLGLEHGGQDNLGSTWYSTPEQFRMVAYLTIFSMSYIAKEEFTVAERNGKMGTENWPYWHWGVLLLYGQNVGLNHLIGSKQLNVVKLFDFLDYPSGNEESIYKKIHIHVFHGDKLFSKFAFAMGKYDNMTVDESDVNKIKYYCLKMALEGKKTVPNQLKQQLDEQRVVKT